MTKPQNIFIFTLLFSVLLVPNDAFGRKKDRNKHGREDIGAMLEPDAMPIRAIQDRNALAAQSMPFYTHKGNINTKYKEGIDVSHYQGTIDWQRVVRSTNISYVYLKATEGANYVDDTYRRNLTEARRAGLSVGSYHFYRASVSPQEQFNNIVRNIKPAEQDLVPIIDIEHRGNVSEEQFIRDLTELIKKVEQYYGKKPLLYSYQNFYNRHFLGLFRHYHWMIAKYQTESPVLLDGRDYIMWQYTSKGSIDGIKGHVDRSRIMGNHNLQTLGM